MYTKDINGVELVRGDSVMLEHAAFVLDSNLPRIPGTIFHIFTDGPEKGIHIDFGGKTHLANSGLILRKVG